MTVIASKSTARFLIALFMLTTALSGCGDETPAPVTIVEFPESEPIVTISAELSGRQLGDEDGIIEIPFILRDYGKDPSGDPTAQVTVEFAKATDGNFEAATPADGSENPAVLESSASGKEYIFKWAVTEDLDRAQTVNIRVTPRNTAGTIGIAGNSTELVVLNDAPSLVDPEASLIGPGLLRVGFRLNDSTEDPTNVLMQIVDGENTRDVLLSEPTLVEGDLEGLATTRAGADHALVWDLRDDVEIIVDNFQISLIPTDAFGAEGEETLLGPFDPIAVDDSGQVKENILPLGPAPESVLRAADGPISLDFVLFGTEMGSADVRLEYVIEGVATPMDIVEIIAHDDPEAVDLDLSALPTSETGLTYTAIWDLGGDISNDQPDVALSFAVSRTSGALEEIEVFVPVLVDGNHNPTVALNPLEPVLTSPEVELTLQLGDTELNLADVEVRVSFDSGENFVTATIDESTPKDNLPTGDGDTVLQWNVQEDIIQSFGGNVFVAHAVVEVSVSDGPGDRLSTSDPIFAGPLVLDITQPADIALSSLQTDRQAALANLDDAIVVTVTVRDEGGDPVAGEVVVVDASGEGNVVVPSIGLTNIEGVFVASLTSRTSGLKTVTARVNPGEEEVTLADAVEVLFQGDPSQISPSLSGAEFTPTGPLPADAITSYSVTVTVVDERLNTIASLPVRATSNTSGVGIGSPLQNTDASGQVTYRVNSTAVGLAVVRFTAEPEGLDAVPFDEPLVLTFNAGEPAKLSFVDLPEEVVAGSPIALLVGFKDEFDNLIQGRGEADVTLEMSSGPEGAVLFGDLESRARFGQGVFAVSLDKAGNYQLTISADGLDSATSPTITVVAGTPRRLFFDTQPEDTAVGALNQAEIRVRAVDAFDNPAVGFASTISLGLGNNPTDAELSGTEPDEVVDGVAIFNRVAVDKAGAGYTLVASALGVESAESEPFDAGLFVQAEARAVGPDPVDVIGAEMDNNNSLDIVVANGSAPGSFGIFLGDGAGGFNAGGTEFISFRPVAAEVSDLNGDNNLDVILLSYDQNLDRAGVQVFAGTGQGGTSNVNSRFTGGTPKAMARGDLNGDDIDDFAVAMADGSLALFRGTDAALVLAAVILPIEGAIDLKAVAIADIDGDNIADILVADDTGPFEGRVWLLDGLGGLAYDTPRQLRVGVDPRALVVGDANGDDEPDLVSVGESDVTILANVGEGRFIPLTTLTPGADPSDVVLVDLDDDDALDIATTNRDSDDVSIFLGDGFGGFTQIASSDAGDSPSSLSAGDFDGDGSTDLIVTNRDSNNITVLLGARP